MGKITFRRLDESDVFLYREFILTGCRETPLDVGLTEKEWGAKNTYKALEAQFRQHDNNPGRFILGAYDGNKLVGTLGFTRNEPIMTRHIAWIWGVQVDSQYRNQGIAKSLFKEMLISSCKCEGLEQIRLKVRSDNETAIKVYQSIGFQFIAKEPEVLKWGDRYIDQFWMMMSLKPAMDSSC